MLRINTDLDDFTHSISHDLRTPLRTIQGFSEILIDEFSEVLDSEGRDYLDRIRKSVYHMDTMILELLEYSKLSRKEVSFSNINTKDILREIISIREDIFVNKSVNIEIKEPIYDVYANRVILKQIFENLIDNALKFKRENNDVNITVWSEISFEKILLYVEDTGIGIPEDSYDRIFNIFERLQPKEYQGTGLGLAIVKKGIQRLDGKCEVVSELNKFTRFCLELENSK